MEGDLPGDVGRNRVDFINDNNEGVGPGAGTATYLSRELFEAVASHNHEALLHVYATHARASLLRYATAKSRWTSWIPQQQQQNQSPSARLRRQHPSNQDQAADEDEEDLVWTARLRQDYDNNTNNSSNSMNISAANAEIRGGRRPNEIVDDDVDEEDNIADDDEVDHDDVDNLSYAAETAITLSSSSGGAPSLADITFASSSSSASAASSSAARGMTSSPLSFAFLSFRPTLSSSMSVPPAPRHRQDQHPGSDNNDASYYRLLKELAQLVSDRARHGEGQSKKKLPKIEVSVETERLLRDSAALLSESRPPHDLVVHARNSSGSSNSSRRGDGNSSGDDEMSSSPNLRSSSSMSNDRPPVFDGGVALATPPPLGGPGAGRMAGAAGGAGTILHLACAVDSPLALAFLLAMGGNPHATHTAFRRMMVHEAACNGSYQCLTLLLELGQEFSSTTSSTTTSSDSATKTVPPPSPSSLMEQLDLPFLPRRMDRSEALAPLQLYLRPFQNQHLSGGGFSPPPFLQRTASSSATPFATTLRDEDGEQGSTDFVSILHLFRECYTQVQEGTMSELDAARKVVATACLNADSRATLATSCGFLPSAAASWNATGAAADTESSTSSSLRPAMSNSFLWRTRPAAIGRGRSAGTNGSASRSGAGLLLNGSSADGHGNTPLHWAAFKNELDCVRLLLKYRANPNARASPSGWTPLHDAAYSNSVETIALLLDAGANVDARANSGATPLCFAAQEDASRAAQLLLERGADLTARCAGTPPRPGDDAGSPHGRFSGYTPLHYCAHYNAHRAARLLLQHPTARKAMEIADLSDRLPIHVAVARGSADVLRELLHAGARVETRSFSSTTSSSAASSSSASRRRRLRSENGPLASSAANMADPGSAPSTPTRQRLRPLPPTPERRTVTPRSRPGSRARSSSGGSSTTSVGGSSTPVSSPVLRSMIPAQPVTSSKPWNCLTQRSIDECRTLISEAEQSWAPDRHELFTPEDRKAVMELLRVGKRLELQGTGIHVQALWPTVLSFCGRGWFQVDDTSSNSSDDEDATIRDGGNDSDACESASDGELDFVTDAAPPSVDTSDDSLTLPTF